MFQVRAVAAVAAVSASVLLAGCSAAEGDSVTDGSVSASDTGEAAEHAPLLRLGMTDSPGEAGFVAADMAFATKASYGQAVYDTLIRATETNELEPSLATSWEYDDSDQVLTMTLRDDVTFTDGTAFTADAAAQNLVRFRDGGSDNASWLAAMESAVALDDSTLQITLSSADPAFLLSLSKAAGYMESPASFDDPTPVGTGPYVLNEVRTVEDSVYYFEANEDYWAPQYQYYDEISMTVYTDPTEMETALLGGELDAALYTGYTGFSDITAAGYTAYSQAVDWTGIVLFDRDGVLNEALGDVRVRQAINYAIDRQVLLDTVAGGVGQITSQVFGPGTDGYDVALDAAYTYNPDKAKELLAEAGYSDGFTLDFPTVSYVPESTFELLAEQLGEVGITLNLTEVGAADYFGTLLAGAVPAASTQLEMPSTAWETYNLEIAASSPWNAMNVEDAVVTELAEQIQGGLEAASSELNNYIVEEAWFVPWYRVDTTFFAADSVTVTLQQGNVYPYLWNIVPTDT